MVNIEAYPESDLDALRIQSSRYALTPERLRQLLGLCELVGVAMPDSEQDQLLLSDRVARFNFPAISKYKANPSLYEADYLNLSNGYQVWFYRQRTGLGVDHNLPLYVVVSSS